MGEPAPILSVVVTTLGTRPEELERLLTSITAERLGTVEIIVVDQSPDQRAHRVAEAALMGSGLPLVHVTSDRGASRGRNAGLTAAQGRVITFPDDDAWYPQGGLTAMLERMDAAPGLDALMFVARGSDGRISSNRFARRAGPVRRHMVFRQGFASAMLFRTQAIRDVNGFDTDIGPGSRGAWGAGEEPDILLRLLAGGATMRFDPTLFVHHEDPALTHDAMRERVRAYSRGVGYVIARNGVVAAHIPQLVVSPATGALVATIRGQRDLRQYRVVRMRAHARGVLDGWRAGRAGQEGG